VPLVIIIKEATFSQTPHPVQFTKLAMDQTEAPGAKTPQICPWCAPNSPDQGQKPRKTAPGGYVSAFTRGQNTGKPSLGAGRAQCLQLGKK